MKKHYFPEIIRVSLSSSFMVRTKCKHCLSSPSVFYAVKNSNCYLDPRSPINHFSYVKRFCKRMCNDYYFFDSPLDIVNSSPFKFTPNFKGYKARLHKNKGVSAYTDYTDMVTCDCGMTNWLFYEESAATRPEIIRRKARYKYPRKFVY